MTEKELLSQLNNLKNIKPDSQWKEGKREILLKQIFGTREYDYDNDGSWLKVWQNMLPHRIVKQLSQPVMVIFLIIIVLASSAVSLRAARDTKPGDSLYIAKIISEKAQLAITFDNKEKAKLGVEFAGNRTKEITQVLAEADDIEKKEARVEKLAQNFKKEIGAVKTRLEKIKAIPAPIATSENTVNDATNIESSEATAEKSSEEEEEMQIFGANLGKSEKGMEISTPSQGGEENQVSVTKDEWQESAKNVDEVLSDNATSTTDSDMINKSKPEELDEVLAEVEKLFDEQDYSGTLDKLEQISAIIDQIDEIEENGTVKGESEDMATTTDNDNLDNGEVLGVNEAMDSISSSTEE